MPTPAVVLGATLLLTIAATAYIADTNRLRERVRFVGAANGAAVALRDRIETAITLLRATSGLFAASHEVDRGEFRAFVARLQLPVHYPGIQGIGYSVRVRADALDSLRRALAAEGVDSFHVWPSDTAAERHAIVYLQPQDRRNRAAMGFDMFSESTRRAAMLRAWTSGRPAASGRLTLVQEIDSAKQAGFLIYLPIYQDGVAPATLEERRERLLGFVYSPFRAGDLLDAVFHGALAAEVDVRVYDGPSVSPDRLLYSSTGSSGRPASAAHRLTLPLDVAGEPWTLEFTPRPHGPITSGRDVPVLLFVFGLLVSLALTAFTRAEARARSGAEAAARELRQSEEAVRASEARFRFLADFIPPLVWTARPDGGVDYVNRRCAEYLGVREAELMAKGWARFIHPADVESAAARWQASLRTGAPYEAEYRLRRGSDGEYRWHLDRGSALREEAGGIARWFGTCTDVEDQRRAAEALRQTQKLESIGVLAGGIAHDFNNLLTGIIGNGSLALDTLPPGHPARPMLTDALRAGERAASLTSQLLAYAGKGRFVLQAVDLCALVRELTQLIRASMPRTVALRLDLADSCPPVRGDASQLQQLVMNLAINGAEAIGEGVGTVTVRVAPCTLDAERLAADFRSYELAPGEYVRLEVEDAGSGMDQATLARIFDPFFTTKFTGRGLGLAAALGIVRGHGGGIAIRSAPGRGSTFTVVLPQTTAAAPDATAPNTAAVPEQNPLSGGVVLLADDEPALRRIGRAALERAGFEVALAVDGREALALAHASADRLRLIVLDLTMPEMGGADVARQLKAAHPRLPIVVTSGYGEEEALARLEGVAVEGFLAKPFTDHQLRQAVMNAVG
ncbi:MAG TPA: CHASE domain-containing protein [Gemmatimonadales bacterium]|nr:CHASE domain-containing protein [Gemmatimonadales bacterium]